MARAPIHGAAEQSARRSRTRSVGCGRCRRSVYFASSGDDGQRHWSATRASLGVLAPPPKRKFDGHASVQGSFAKGSKVRVRAREELLAFQRSWKFHHPVSDDMLSFAGQQTTVVGVGFYHGGDVLYHLDGIPGTWHETCLEGFKEALP